MSRADVAAVVALQQQFFFETLGFVPEQELPVLGQPMTHLTRRIP
jgi:hypothetical protein